MKQFGLLLSFKFEALTFILVTYWLGDYLNKKQVAGLGFNWYFVLVPLCIALICFQLFMFIKNLLKMQNDIKTETPKEK